MKNLIFILGISVLIFEIIYLLGAFNQASFNIKDWSQDTRDWVVGVTGFIQATFIVVFLARELAQKDKENESKSK